MMTTKPTSLEESTARYKRHNDEMEAKLFGQKSPAFERVVAAPDVALDDATERARQHWDAMEAKMALRASSPPPPPSTPGVASLLALEALALAKGVRR